MNCDVNIAQDIYALECNPTTGKSNISIKGVHKEGLIFNRADFISDPSERVQPANAGNTYSVLPLKDGAKAYKIIQPANNPFEGTKTEAVKGKFITTFNHTLQFVILNHGNVITNIIEKLANGEFVVMLQNNQNNAQPSTGEVVANVSPWQIYGLDNGLVLETAVRELYNDDTLAGWLVTMSETGTPHAGTFATADLIESYLNPAEIQLSYDTSEPT